MPSSFQVWFMPLSLLAVTTLLAIPLSRYLAWIMDGRYRAAAWLRWIERRVDTGPQDWKHYAIAMMLSNTVMFIFGFLVLAIQPMVVRLNPDGKGMLAPTTIFNSVTSFLTNTNLQHYCGEQHLSYFSQIFFVMLEHVPFGERRAMRADGDYSRAARRRAHGQLLPRHVARRGLPVRAAEPGDGRFAAGRRRPHDDGRLRQGRHGRSGRHGTAERRQGPAAGNLPRTGRRDHPHQALGNQRRRVLRRQLVPSLREPQRLEQLPHGDEPLPLPLRAGLHVRPHVAANAPRLGDLRRHDGDVPHDHRLGGLL